MERPIQIPQTFNHHMLTLGRQSRGMSIAALARGIGVTSHELQWMEQGKVPFPPDLLPLLSDVLDYPEAFFAQNDLIYAAAHRFWPCESFDMRVWRKYEEQEAARREERKQVNRLRRRVRELEAQLQAQQDGDA